MTPKTGRFKAGPRIVRLTLGQLEALGAELGALGILCDAAALLHRLARVARPHLRRQADDAQQ